VSAPADFAFDDQHHLITVNSANFQSGTDTSLQYDGSTKLLTSSAAVTPGAHSIHFSIFDAGDHVYDSAMFLDNLRAYSASDCAAGATLADSDGDGLPDQWETHGVTADGQFIDLPRWVPTQTTRMGSKSPDHENPLPPGPSMFSCGNSFAWLSEPQVAPLTGFITDEPPLSTCRWMPVAPSGVQQGPDSELPGR
jgi:hypothetical protein